MAGRGRGRGRGPRGPPRQEYYQESLELGRKELDLENKKIEIELRSNDQGKFIKIIERIQSQTSPGTSSGRGRIIFNLQTASTFRSILNEFVAEYQRLPPASEEVTESERLKTDSFNQGRRRYYVDLRQNQRGRFLKLSMLAGGKTFVAIPGEELVRFRDEFVSLLDESGGAPSSSGGATGGRQTPPPSSNPLPDTREVRAGGKKFFFDVDRNDRGTFIRLSEVLSSGRGRRTHINIPQECWSKMGSVFQSYASELPLSSEREDESSGSDDN